MTPNTVPPPRTRRDKRIGLLAGEPAAHRERRQASLSEAEAVEMGVHVGVTITCAIDPLADRPARFGFQQRLPAQMVQASVSQAPGQLRCKASRAPLPASRRAAQRDGAAVHGADEGVAPPPTIA